MCAMMLTFVSNYINHHQIPVSEELYRLTGGSYTFIQTEPMEEERVAMGWDEKSSQKSYVRLYYENPAEAEKLILESDCVIFGGTPMSELIIPRLEAGKFTLRYDERLYKTGRWKFISPRGLKQKYYDHIRFRKSPVYFLCAGAYVKGDFQLIHAYPKKMLKYGYFPELREYADVHELRRNNSKLEIMWAGRFIDWKHPEIMVSLAKAIANKGIDAHITMIGNGPLFESIINSVNGYEDYISFAGVMSPDEVRAHMLVADIFISTSNRQEGWGAVINEAMNSGCVTIAAKEIGAAPYLIKHGENGYLYHSCDEKELVRLIADVADNRDKCYEIGSLAYETILTTWNPKVAAKRIVEFITDSNHNIYRYKEGPLSPA